MPDVQKHCLIPKPEINTTGRRSILTRVVLVITLVFVSSAITSCSRPTAEDTEATQQASPATMAKLPIQVHAVRASQTALRQQLKLPGIAKAHKKATVAAETSGRITLRAIEPGDSVDLQQTLLNIDQQRTRIAVEEARAMQRSAEVALASTESELQRGVDLSKKQFISEDRLEQLEFARQSASANLEAARAALLNAERAHADTLVQAPFSGTIERVYVHEGDYVTPGSPLFELADFSQLRIVTGVTASEAALIQPRGIATLSFNNVNAEALHGTVHSVGRIADATTGTYPVEIWIESDTPAYIREGMIATVALPYQSQNRSLAIPPSAVVRRDGENYVYRVVENSARLTEVEVGRSSAEYIEIFSGITEGDTVITDGVFALKDGSPVEAVISNQ